MSSLIHLRYITFTTYFHNQLKSSGFVLDEKESYVNRSVFKGVNKKVVSELDKLTLLEKLPGGRTYSICYQGLSISKLTLDFFLNTQQIFKITKKW